MPGGVGKPKHSRRRWLVVAALSISLAGLQGCSTTAEDPSEPWAESLENDVCEESIRGTSSCDL